MNSTGLTSLPADAFSGLTALTFLSLSDNTSLGTLPANQFSGLTRLRSVDLTRTGTTMLPAGLFSGLSELLTILLSSNALESVPAGVFSGLSKLRYLDLGLNSLGALPAGVFEDLTALTELRLPANDLTSLPDGVFFGLTGLTDLNLRHNPDTDDVLPLTVTVEKVGTDQVRAKVAAGAPVAVEFTPAVVNGALAGGATVLRVPAGAVEGTAVTVERTSGTTAAATVDIDLTTQPSLPTTHKGYEFVKATSGLPATILPQVGGLTASVADGMASEGDNVEFVVTLSAESDEEVTVAVATSVETGDTAISGTDFTAKTETLTFAADETSKTVTVATTGDELAEGNETFTLRLSNPTNAEILDATATGTIEDDDQPTVAISDEDVREEDGEIEFEVKLDKASTVPITVDWATEAGSAEADVDYVEASGTLTFAPDDTEKTITVDLIDDDLLEGLEKFTVRLSGTDDALVTLGTSSSTGRIIDSDRATITVAEETTVDEDAGTVTLTLTASALSAAAYTIDYATEDGTAEAGADYTAANGQVRFPALETEQTITITVLDDAADEDREDFNGGRCPMHRTASVDFPTAPASVLIEDDDPEPTLSVADAEATEGSPVSFTVTLTPPSGRQVTVAVATSVETGDTATSGTDFTAKTETLTFAAGDTEQTFTVATAADSTAEDAEIFTVTLSGETNAGISDATATGRIVPPVVTIAGDKSSSSRT